MGLLSRAGQVQHGAAPPPDPDPKPAPSTLDSSADLPPVPAAAPTPAAGIEPAPEPPEPAHRVRNQAPSVDHRRPSDRTASAPPTAVVTPRQPSGKASTRSPRGTADRPPRSRTAQRAPAQPRVAGAAWESVSAPTQPSTAAPAREPGRAPGQVCPVVGRPVCYYGDCHHWSGDRCGHPDATGNRRARRSRTRRAASGTAPAVGA